VFSADTLEDKLTAPPGGLRALTDQDPGAAIPWTRPSRPEGLRIAPRHQRKKFPHPNSLDRVEMRVRCLHAFANHELMALEMMAWALLAFPQAPASFRRGLAKILMDEQEHFRLYCGRLQTMGLRFGELPVNDHFWRAGQDITSPLDWVCTMHLTFEQSNLDHAPYFGRLFHEAGDLQSAELMRRIFADEIGHVRFGGRWLKDYAAQEKASAFEVYARHCSGVYPPYRAKGLEFQHEARLKAGLDEQFVRSLRAWESDV
jgi:uncharacterized ferritin-like protein (DUF455 family)